MDFTTTSIPTYFLFCFVFILAAIEREDVQDQKKKKERERERIYPEFIQMWWRNKGVCSVTWYLSKGSMIGTVLESSEAKTLTQEIW